MQSTGAGGRPPLPEAAATGAPDTAPPPPAAVDADRYLEPLRAERERLTAYGEGTDLAAASAEEVRSLPAGAGPREEYACSTRVGGVPSGRVSPVPVDPPRYGLGHRPASAATGRGRATAACASLIGRARDLPGATDVFAGVSPGDGPGGAVPHRPGFSPVARFPRRHPLPPGAVSAARRVSGPRRGPGGRRR